MATVRMWQRGVAAVVAGMVAGATLVSTAVGFERGRDLRDLGLARSVADPFDRYAVSVDQAVGDDAVAAALAGTSTVVDVDHVSEGRVAVALEPGTVRHVLAAVDGVTEVDVDPLAVLTTTAPAQGPVVEPVASLTGATAPADPYYPLQWALENTGQVIDGRPGVAGADVGWRGIPDASTGAGVTVAIVDSGIDLDHPDLAGRWATNEGETCGDGRDDDGNGYVDDCIGWDLVNGDATVDDGRSQDHATHVAGVIAAHADATGIAGVAPGVTILPVKISEGGGFPMSRAAAGIRYAVDRGADVVNASFGTAPGWSGTGADMVAALEYAHARGVTVVAAAGNDGVDTDAVRPPYPAGAPVPNVVSVGASTHDDVRASFSNHGEATVDLFAPGARIASTVDAGGYAYMSGTSMAAPHVTAAVALLLAEQPDLSPEQVRAALTATAVPVPALDGYAAAGRLHLPTLLGTHTATTPLQMRVEGADRFADTGRLDVHVTLPNADRVDGLWLRVTLATWFDGALHGVVDHPVTVTHAGVDRDLRTDAEAALDLTGPLTEAELARLGSDGLRLGLATDLPPGTYHLLVEAVDPADPTVPVDRPVLTVVTLPGSAAPPTGPTAPPPGGGTGGSGDHTSPPTGGDTGAVDAAPSPPSGGPGTSHDWDTGVPGDTGGGRDGGPGDVAGPTLRLPSTDVQDPPVGSPRPATGGVDPDPPTATAPTGPGVGGAPPAPTPLGGPGPAPAPPDAGASEPDPGVGSVHPDHGPTSGRQVVTIDLADPVSPVGDVHVRFGSSHATVVHAGGRTVIVTTPPHLAGTVDVTVAGAADARFAAAYTFVDDAADGPAGPAPRPSPPPGDDPGVATGPPDPVAPVGRTAGQPFRAPNGLLLDRLTSAHPLTAARSTTFTRAACSAASCLAVPL